VRLAADLHLHSRYSDAVSPQMTVENIARVAQQKGINLLSTGDCLQSDWLREIETAMEEVASGFFVLKPEVLAGVHRGLTERLRASPHFVLGTEVCCAPPGTPRFGGIHHLIYFPSFESVRRFRAKLTGWGNLQEGRPTLALDSRHLFEMVLAHDDRCHFAPAHLFNPWYSSLGTISGGRTLEEIFGEFTTRLLAVETGLTATPAMCRRVPALDRHVLFSNSDAHSLDNIGRECTLLEIEPDYDSLFTALHSGAAEKFLRTLKVPVQFARYYLNWCGRCQEGFDGRACPRCHQSLVMGSRDRLEVIARRSAPFWPECNPPFQEMFPLGDLLARFTGNASKGSLVQDFQMRLRTALGHERFILTEATFDEIAAVGTAQLARAIVTQRTETPVLPRDQPGIAESGDQMSLGF
jgi:DNA helicase II / ATP-dependent DNA helicase PcrA